MTMIGTEVRPARSEEAEQLRPEAALAIAAERVDGLPPSPPMSRPALTWVDVEDVEPRRAPSRWFMLFAWAKVTGGW